MMHLTFISQYVSFCFFYVLANANFVFLTGVDNNPRGSVEIDELWFLNTAPIMIKSLIINIFTP